MRLATVTAVYNEAVLLPQFLRHYIPQVDQIFLLDNESTDGSLDAVRGVAGVSIETYKTNGEFRYTLKHRAIQGVIDRCRGEFDYVLVVDVDEFVMSRSGVPLGLELEFLQKSSHLWVHGFQMFQSPSEGPYNPRLPLIEQRISGFEDHFYSKPLIVDPRAEVPLGPGIHYICDSQKPSIEAIRKSPFLLFHYTGLDEDFYVDRCMVRVLRLSPENVEKGYSHHYYEQSPEFYRKRFVSLRENTADLSHLLRA